MNRNKAIQWCKAELKYWPNTPRTRTPAPEGWYWIVKNIPYNPNEMILINNKELAINKRDVIGGDLT